MRIKYLCEKFPNFIKQLFLIAIFVFAISMLFLIFNGKQFVFLAIIKTTAFLYLLSLIINSPIKINKESKYYINGTYEQIKKIDDDMGGFIYNIEVFNLFGKMIKTYTLTEKEYILYTKKTKFYVNGSVINLLSLILLGFSILTIFFILVLI